MSYIYESCCGNLYATDKPIENIYCDICDDYDTLKGVATCKEDVYKLFDGDINISGSEG